MQGRALLYRRLWWVVRYSVRPNSKDYPPQRFFPPRIFEMGAADGDKATEFGDDRVFNDLRYTINSDKLHALGWTEV